MYEYTLPEAYRNKIPIPDERQAIARMAGKAHTSAKRILKELSNYERGPSEALVHLAPINDDDLMHWTGVMKGVQGTAYEGQDSHMLYSVQINSTCRRWTVAA